MCISIHPASKGQDLQPDHKTQECRRGLTERPPSKAFPCKESEDIREKVENFSLNIQGWYNPKILKYESNIIIFEVKVCMKQCPPP